MSKILELADAYALAKYSYAHVPSMPAEARAALVAALEAADREREQLLTEYRESVDSAVDRGNQIVLLKAEIERLKSFKEWYDAAMVASNVAGYSGVTAAQTISDLDSERDALRAENSALRSANTMLDAALILMCPQGAQGHVFEMWNAARAALGEQT